MDYYLENFKNLYHDNSRGNFSYELRSTTTTTTTSARYSVSMSARFIWQKKKIRILVDIKKEKEKILKKFHQLYVKVLHAFHEICCYQQKGIFYTYLKHKAITAVLFLDNYGPSPSIFFRFRNSHVIAFHAVQYLILKKEEENVVINTQISYNRFITNPNIAVSCTSV